MKDTPGLPDGCFYWISTCGDAGRRFWSVPLSTPFVQRQRALYAALGATVLALSAHAQTIPAPTSLAPVVVTAARHSQNMDRTFLFTSVITRADIERLAPLDLLSLLGREASVDIAQNGHPGSVASIFLRGAESRQTLVLIDGVRAGSATIGATALDQLSPDQIEQIEIVRGNVSSLYGANAMGGVINIITRKGRGPVQGHVALLAGSRTTSRLAAGLGGENGDVYGRVDLSAQQTDGVSAIDATRYAQANPDRDGYANRSINLAGGWRFARAWQLTMGVTESRGEVDFDNAFARSANDTHRADNQVRVWRAAIDRQWSDDWSTQLRWAKGLDVSDNATNGARASRFATTSDQWSLEMARTLGEWGRIAGALEHLSESVDATTRFVATDRKVKSGWLQWTAQHGVHEWQAVARRDVYSDFGSASTGLASYAWAMTPGIRIIGSVANAFAAPTFNQLYFPGFGNSALTAEQSRSAELGLQWSGKAATVRIQTYRTDYRDLIASGPPSFLPQNVQRARVEGLELMGRWVEQQWQAQAAYTYQEPRNQTTGSDLLRRPRHKANAEVFHATPLWGAGAAVDWVGTRSDRTLTTSQVFSAPAYTLLHLHAHYHLRANLTVRVRLENITDKAYESAAGYSMPRRGVFVSLAWSPTAGS
jgi:vitamin B12 transporter